MKDENEIADKTISPASTDRSVEREAYMVSKDVMHFVCNICVTKSRATVEEHQMYHGKQLPTGCDLCMNECNVQRVANTERQICGS